MTRYTVHGQIAQYARMTPEPGQAIWASKGAIMSYTSDVRWNLRMPGGAGGVAKRLLSGEGVSLLYIETDRPGQSIMLGVKEPGHLMEWDLADGPVMTTRGSFVAAWGDDIGIDVTIAKRAGAMLFGGAGLFLQRISGSGKVLLHGSGDFQDTRLEPGQELFTSTGNLAAFAADVDYNIQAVGSVGKFFFSGEGLFLTKLTGPGRVLLQSLKRTHSKGGS